MTHASGHPGRLAAVPPPPPVTVAELRDAHTALLEAELGALEVIRRVYRECPGPPGATGWELTEALDPARRDAARKILDRLARAGIPLADTA